MIKPLPIGSSNFYEIIKENCYYIDKTKVIEELLIKNRLGVILFSRPRRFGKSLFISMLENFFNVDKKEVNKDLFDGLYISKSIVYEDNLNRYPVIKLDLKDLKCDTFRETMNDFKGLMAEVYRDKKYVLECLEEDEKVFFHSILNKEAALDNYDSSLATLSKWLERYHKEKTIILIDEYDTPIENGRNCGYHDEIMKFIKTLFGKAFKGNDSLKMGVLTGVLRIS